MDKIDVLKREEFVNQLIVVTEKISESKKSTSFAIDGKWGSGKSFVLDMFEEKIGQKQDDEARDKYFIIRYNCWEYDYYEEPLVAIVATMLDSIDKKMNLLSAEKREKVKGLLKAVGATLFSVASGTIKSTTGVDLSKAYKIVTAGLSSGKDKYEKANEYDKYFSFRQALKSLHEVLNELSKQYTVVFLIDELDRCLPEYTIKVLERLHHLIEGTQKIIHIMSIDKVQLQTSIERIFGFKDTEKYLKKFIQFTVTLNLGEISEKITDKYSDYIGLFDKDLIPFDDSIEEFMQSIFQKIDVREQESIIHRVTIAHNILFSEPKDYGFMCMELLIAITNTCYKNTIYLCKALENFNGLQETDKATPFNTFFEEKFKAIPANSSRFSGNSLNSESRILISKNSLYAVIFAMWYELFLNNELRKGMISVNDNDLNAKLNENVQELKVFTDFIKFIK